MSKTGGLSQDGTLYRLLILTSHPRKEMSAQRGRQFIPRDVDAFLAAAEAEPTVHRPRAVFGNPDREGYGGGPWPFDHARAITDDGYRAGVYNAMVAEWTASNWKAAAQRELNDVWLFRRMAARWHRDVGKRRGYSYKQSLELILGRIPH